jgi:hypothetical protein
MRRTPTDIRMLDEHSIHSGYYREETPELDRSCRMPLQEIFAYLLALSTTSSICNDGPG